MNLSDLRKEIDLIDEQILKLLNRRAELAKKIGEAKTRHRSQYFTPEREHQVFAKIVKQNSGPLTSTNIRAIYTEIISSCRALEKPISVAFLGPEGTFSHQAVLTKFGSASNCLPVDTISDVFKRVERNETDYGMVPMENSLAGAITETLDNFMRSNMRIVSEVFIPVVHNLVTRCVSLDQIKRVYSHPQPISQCRQWLRNHLQSAEILEVSSTARAAEIAAAEEGSAAIATRLAAERNQLPLLCTHIEDDPSNRTRFLVLGYNQPEPSGKDKTSIMFSVPNRAGELFRAMAAFEKYNVNLTMIESRPPRVSAWDYVFYLDVQGHIQDENVAKAVSELKEAALFVTVLGSYPAGE